MSYRHREINVLDPVYGAKGDGSWDDTVAFQKAFTEAWRNGWGGSGGPTRIVIPAPKNYYKLTSTVVGTPPGSPSRGFSRVDIVAEGPWYMIQWAGGNDTSVFKIYGWKFGTIDGLKVVCYGKTGVTVFDHTDKSPDLGSTGLCTWRNCLASLADGSNPANDSTNCNGFRWGHEGTTDVSFVTVETCAVTSYNSGGFGAAATNGNVGFRIENQNVLVFEFHSCGGSFLNKFFTTVPSPGSANALGGNTISFYNCGCSDNYLDFELAIPGPFLISGGRYEDGARFMQSPFFGGAMLATVESVSINTYRPSDGILFALDGAANLTLDNVDISRGTASPGVANSTPFPAPMITFNNAWWQSLTVKGGSIHADDPFYTYYGSRPQIRIDNVHKRQTNGGTIGFFVDPARPERRDILVNGNIELWSSAAPTTHANTGSPGTDTNCYAWKAWGYAAGDSVTVTKETGSANLNPPNSTASMKVVVTRSSDCRVYQNAVDAVGLRGKRVQFRVWAKTNVANGCNPLITDGVSTVQSSSGHTGDNTWQLMSCDMKIADTATSVLFMIPFLTGTYYIDGCDVTVGHVGTNAPIYTPDPTAEMDRVNSLLATTTPAWTVSNYTAQRSFDAGTADLDAVANAVATLVADLKARREL